MKGAGKAGRWLSPLNNHIIPKLGKRAIAEIDQHDLRQTLNPIWNTKQVTAARALSRFKLVLDHAVAMGADEVDMTAPAKARVLLGAQRREVRHIPSLPYDQAPDFYSWLCGKSGSSALALRFLMLTVARTSEVRLASFEEIEEDLWILPDHRTKTGTEHRIPLTTEALRVVSLAREASGNGNLFTSPRGKPLSDMAMLMRKNGHEARPHGFRATFRTWVEEQTEMPFEVKEAALGHAVDTGVVRSYQRSDRLEKRRVLLVDWQQYLLSQLN